jgi:broad specificity phosphatase PhoE
MKITFLRHGQSEANEAGIWQGSRHGGRLTARGVEQSSAVAARLSRRPPDLVVTSGLERTIQTAAPLGVAAESDSAWREMDLGEWDGLTFAAISEMYSDELIAVFAGEPIPMGRTGETILEVRQRLSEALESLQSRLDEGDRAVVVTHGGVIETLARMHWKIDAPTRAFADPLNASLTTFRHVFGRLRLATYNDTGHLGTLNEWTADHLAEGDRVLTFVRHGETDANVEGRVQGQTDWGLNEHGRSQATRLAEWYGPQDVVFSSPLGRARETAGAIAANGVKESSDLSEIGFGSWEGMTFDEVRVEDADLADRIFLQGEDLPRGGDGETWADLRARMERGVGDVIASNGSGRLTVVSHGGSIRAYVLGNLGVGWPEVLDTIVPRNTAVTHVVLTATGPVLADYAVAAHLE